MTAHIIQHFPLALQHSTLAFFVALLATAFLLGAIAEKVRVPYTVALLLASAPLYFPHLPIQFGPPVLIALLPALIFEGAWNLDSSALRRTWKTVAVLAAPGVLFTAAIIGGGLYALGQLPPTQAILLGVILSATDPVAVIATFRRVSIPLELLTIIDGESLFNDATAVVLYGLAAGLIGVAITPANGAFIACAAIGVSLGGALIGLLTAFCVALVMRVVRDPMLQMIGAIVAAYGAYVLADTLHLSGIFATIVAGIGLRRLTREHISPSDARNIDDFLSILAFCANSLLFLLMGLRIEFVRIFHHPALLIGTLALLILSRSALVYGILPLMKPHGYQGFWRPIAALAGMRGALSLALALGLPDAMPMRAEIIDAVFAAVFVTLTTQGLTIGPLTASRTRSEHQPAYRGEV